MSSKVGNLNSFVEVNWEPAKTNPANGERGI